MKKTIIFLSFLTAVLAMQAFAQNGSKLEKIKQKKELVVGFCAQYPPFESKNDQGEFEGFDVDLGRALADRLGVKAVFKDGEWQGLIAGMNKGDYDILITCMSENNARKNNVNFSNPYYDHPEIIVVSKQNEDINGISDLKNKIIGVQMATSSEQCVEKYKNKIGEIKKYNYTTEAFLDVKYGRIDAVVCGEPYAIMQIKKDKSFKILSEHLNTSDVVMIIPKGEQELTQKINDALEEIKSDGTYDELYNKWLSI